MPDSSSKDLPPADEALYDELRHNIFEGNTIHAHSEAIAAHDLNGGLLADRSHVANKRSSTGVLLR